MKQKLLYAGWGATAVLCLVLGLGIGWAIWGRSAGAEGPRPEVRQDDGSVVLERAPEQVPSKPPHAIPEGGTEARRVEITLYPKDPDCPPLDLTLSLVRFGDGSARVVASSENGRISEGIDIPFEDRSLAFERRQWAAGVSYAGEGAHGVYLQRDLWRFRVGLEVNALRDGGTEARATVGWTW